MTAEITCVMAGMHRPYEADWDCDGTNLVQVMVDGKPLTGAGGIPIVIRADLTDRLRALPLSPTAGPALVGRYAAHVHMLLDPPRRIGSSGGGHFGPRVTR